ncbi:peroxiredoxin family protein [Allorhodopirellula solitaria]|uniref:Thiol-disulfide oxidoreductase ResA n=1 Tax=Allorhodopirellula solitaria TaxID=2527987 RepID=A0A5C5XZ37_9BACT|nr:TlpA disulfide reductase family protein [Allorhodopirellula solitaria]TWT67205.1 Thiol-disulfide oxidoreductase ResA [Allorhodopirellula solitaria]
MLFTSPFRVPLHRILSAALLTTTCLVLHASADGVLKPGSKAPDIDISNWWSDGDGNLEHTTKFQPGSVYVIEFWATWCGPCLVAMPHLSEIQDEYADRNVQIISVSDEPSETVQEFLQKTVLGRDDQTYEELTSNYCLTSDPDGSVSKDYLMAARQSSIPCAFIVGKTGNVEWIGNPMKLAKPLKAIVDGNWDRPAYLKEYEFQMAARRRNNALRSLRTADTDTEDQSSEILRKLEAENRRHAEAVRAIIAQALGQPSASDSTGETDSADEPDGGGHRGKTQRTAIPPFARASDVKIFTEQHPPKDLMQRIESGRDRGEEKK